MSIELSTCKLGGGHSKEVLQVDSSIVIAVLVLKYVNTKSWNIFKTGF